MVIMDIGHFVGVGQSREGAHRSGDVIHAPFGLYAARFIRVHEAAAGVIDCLPVRILYDTLNSHINLRLNLCFILPCQVRPFFHVSVIVNSTFLNQRVWGRLNTKTRAASAIGCRVGVIDFKG